MKSIAAKLSDFFNVPVVPGETLLFLDEIQKCEDVIHSLWFFKEDYPELHVIAAGSLLEFALKNLSSLEWAELVPCLSIRCLLMNS